MEKLKNAITDLDMFLVKIDCIAGLSHVLWESMSEGTSEVDKDYTNAAFLLNEEIRAFNEKIHKISEQMYCGLKEMRE